MVYSKKESVLSVEFQGKLVPHVEFQVLENHYESREVVLGHSILNLSVQKTFTVG